MKLYYFSLFFILAACATLPDRKIAQVQDVEYYYGDVNLSSADGKISYGKFSSLVKRIIDPANKTITEIVLQPPRNPQQQPKDINTKLTQIGNSNVFQAVDDGHTFEGKMTFEGSEWKWNQWSYEIELLDGSTLKGTGLIDSEGIKTQKMFYKPDGTASVLLKEDLKSIDSTKYKAHHDQIIGN